MSPAAASTVWSAVSAVLAFAITSCGVQALRQHPLRVDVPNARSSHSRPTPRGGGLAIVIACALLAFCTPGVERRISAPAAAAVLAAALLVAAVSLADDLRHLSFRLRLLAHAAAAVIVISVIGTLDAIDLPFVGEAALGAFAAPLTVLWIVGCVNAYNFMDGIDGIAGCQAMAAGLGWALLGRLAGAPLVSHIGLLVAASSAAFLLHNWSPARIFLGDVGSASLGFIFAVLPILAARAAGDAEGAGAGSLTAAAALLVWPFLFDTVFTFLARLRRRENVFAAHRSHLYQRLVLAGWSHRAVAGLYTALAALGLAAAALVVLRPAAGGAAWAAIALAAGALWSLVRRCEKRRAAGCRGA